MRQRERQPEQRWDPPQPVMVAGGGDLDAARAQAERLNAAGANAIASALSHDSETFLRDNQQRGGE